MSIQDNSLYATFPKVKLNKTILDSSSIPIYNYQKEYELGSEYKDGRQLRRERRKLNRKNR